MGFIAGQQSQICAAAGLAEIFAGNFLIGGFRATDLAFEKSGLLQNNHLPAFCNVSRAITSNIEAAR